MQLAYIWYDPAERVMTERIIQRERPTWHLKCIAESETGGLDSAIAILKAGYDAILLHLSKPPCFALKLAELAHHERLATRVLIMSKTDADPEAIKTLFDGHIHPDRDVAGLADKIEKLLGGSPTRNKCLTEIEDSIVQILNTDSVFQYQFRQAFQVLYRDPFTISDYHQFATAHLSPTGVDYRTRLQGRVFISYSSDIQSSAMFLSQFLMERGVPTFLASRDLEGGDEWEKEIRGAIQTCAEMLILITPESVTRPWVMAEMGAAWILGKRITPCLVRGSVAHLPDLLTRRQVEMLSDWDAIQGLAQRVATRIQEIAGSNRAEPEFPRDGR